MSEAQIGTLVAMGVGLAVGVLICLILGKIWPPNGA